MPDLQSMLERVPNTRQAFGFAVVLLALLLEACSPSKSPEVVRLAVSSIGTYDIEGVPVQREALVAELVRHRSTDGKLFVHVAPAQGAAYNDVHAAVEAVQKAGGQVGMVGNEIFYPPAPSSGVSR